MQLLADGKITADEANELLKASSSDKNRTIHQGVANVDKFIYVSVEPKDTIEGKKTGRVFVKIPFALIKAGFNIAGLIPKNAQEEINEGLRKQGMSFDFSDLTPENVNDIMTSLEEVTIEVDNEDSLIRVYCK